MLRVQDLCEYLHLLAPLELAEPWDNVGLLLGSYEKPVRSVMTCLTVTPESVAEAVREQVDLIVTHHPFPFHPLKRVTEETVVGSMISRLIRAEVSVYSAHTAYDSAARGINQQLIEGVGCHDIRPLVPREQSGNGVGSARYGQFADPKSVGQLVDDLQRLIGSFAPRITHGGTDAVRQVAVACGSGGSFLEAARNKSCDLLIVGEASFHTCLEAQARGVRLLLLGHFASERFAMQTIAQRVTQQFPTLRVWASHDESDPIQSI